MVIRGRAPLRVSFGGGGTDVAPFCEEMDAAREYIPELPPERKRLGVCRSRPLSRRMPIGTR